MACQAQQRLAFAFLKKKKNINDFFMVFSLKSF
jgi:hypothetical protein